MSEYFYRTIETAKRILPSSLPPSFLPSLPPLLTLLGSNPVFSLSLLLILVIINRRLENSRLKFLASSIVRPLSATMRFHRMSEPGGRREGGRQGWKGGE